MNMVRITAPGGKKIRHMPSGNLYSEVICDEAKASKFVLADSEGDLTVVELNGVTLEERVSDLEDAVIELAEIITEV